MKRNSLFATLLVSLLLGGATSSAFAEDNAPIRLAHSTWIGYGPLYIAKEKGFFNDEGVDVDLQIIESSSDSITALAAERLDAVASTLDSFTLFAGNGAALKVVVAIDDSKGGDGIVAKKDIATPADLKGHSIAVQKGSASQFLLSQVLARNKLTLDDVTIIDMKAGDAGAAFVTGRVDAAVTWQPWLGRAKETEFGHVLASTSDWPGLVVDAVAFRNTYVMEHPKAVQGFVNGYSKAIAFLQARPAEAQEIISRNLKMTSDSVEASLKDVQFLGAQENAAFFGGEAAPAFQLATDAGKFYQNIGILAQAPDPTTFLDPSFVEQR